LHPRRNFCCFICVQQMTALWKSGYCCLAIYFAFMAASRRVVAWVRSENPVLSAFLFFFPLLDAYVRSTSAVVTRLIARVDRPVRGMTYVQAHCCNRLRLSFFLLLSGLLASFASFLSNLLHKRKRNPGADNQRRNHTTAFSSWKRFPLLSFPFRRCRYRHFLLQKRLLGELPPLPSLAGSA